MGHQFLVAAYLVTWTLQLGYLARLLIMSRTLKLATLSEDQASHIQTRNN